METLSDETRAEIERQILTTFNEIKMGVEQLHKRVEELAASLPELNASLREIGKVVQILAGEPRVE